MKADAELSVRQSLVNAANGVSAVADLSPHAVRVADSVITPPNSSVMFAECASIPTLTGEIAPGEHWLGCAVMASGNPRLALPVLPTLHIENNTLNVTDNVSGKIITLNF